MTTRRPGSKSRHRSMIVVRFVRGLLVGLLLGLLSLPGALAEEGKEASGSERVAEEVEATESTATENTTVEGTATEGTATERKSSDRESTEAAKSKRALRPIRDKWALVVGISKFKDEKINLKYASKDAKDFAKFLTDECNFAPDHVLVLTDENATRANILGALGAKWLPRLAHPNDLVVLFFSTHGSPSEADVGGVNYLIAHDTEVDNLYATGVPMQDLTRMIKARVYSDRVLIMLDACHSGATSAEGKGIHRIGNFDADAIAQGTGQLVISSSSPTQRSWESTHAQNGVFTSRLIEALKAKGTSTTLGTAFDNLKENVETEVLRDRGVLQTPVLKSKWEGADLVLAVPPSKPGESMPFDLSKDDAEGEQSEKSGPREKSGGSAKTGGSEKSGPNEKTGRSEKSGDDEGPQRDDGVSGQWDSNWGAVTLEHPPLEGDKKVKVTGYWIQAIDSNRGVIRSGSFDPKTGELKLSYWQSWNMMPGKASLKLSEDGKRLEGKWKHFGLAGGDWSMWRK